MKWGGGLDGLFVNEVKVFYGFNDSPLDRMLAAFSNLDDSDYLVRIDGLHFAIDMNDLVSMYSFAILPIWVVGRILYILMYSKSNKFIC